MRFGGDGAMNQTGPGVKLSENFHIGSMSFAWIVVLSSTSQHACVVLCNVVSIAKFDADEKV